MAYTYNLPANMRNTDILRAIYDKVDEIHPIPTPTDIIELKLDTLIVLTDEVNTNIILNTQAIKDVSVNVIVNNIIDIDTSKITKSIDDLKETNNKGFANINNKIINLTETYKKLLSTLKETINTGFNKTEKAIESLKSSLLSYNTIENSQELKSLTKKDHIECKLYGHWMFLPYPNYYNLHFETPESKLDRERKSMKVLESTSKCNTKKVNNKVDWGKLYQDYTK